MLARLRRPLLILAAVAVFLFLSFPTILHAAGEYLVHSDPPTKADAIVVLAGDSRGHRIMRAAELVRDGYAPVALVSGPAETYGVNEADLAIQYAVRRGAPASYFQPTYGKALSTLEEANGFAPELQRRGVRKVIIVTSTYHTRRANAIFHRVLGPKNIEVSTIAAQDPYFQADSWWHNREGQKTLFFEYSKTVADWLGM